MPDYAEVAGVTSAYANGMGHQSHTSTSPLYDSCGAYATTSLIGTTNIYHQNTSPRYDNQPSQQQQQQHYNNVIRNGPFVYPNTNNNNNKKNSSTSLNTPRLAYPRTSPPNSSGDSPSTQSSQPPAIPTAICIDSGMQPQMK